MQRRRAEFEHDRSGDSPTEFETSTNKFEAVCGMCGGKMFVDHALKARLESAREQGLEDNPLVCGRCEADMNEAAAEA
ncbi:MAG: hypothetical protein DWQ47_01500 [Acidobacteria bacterium]|nr:MAG: hypothetical protein DWQ32_11960 [Acidobacteriota bacterium]REK04172.1 MAG: hypothetical protein DWQ38_01485 [Acidobacteriota bacterium]REK15334.1 MAG: hypothetical protein DWQ43_17650 [Acidobacteriota bacterium]REK46424.1 MAG: hypothetical protein DWQ47_01500 [Acidobacteriota bacterium]